MTLSLKFLSNFPNLIFFSSKRRLIVLPVSMLFLHAISLFGSVGMFGMNAMNIFIFCDIESVLSCNMAFMFFGILSTFITFT